MYHVPFLRSRTANQMNPVMGHTWCQHFDLEMLAFASKRKYIPARSHSIKRGCLTYHTRVAVFFVHGVLIPRDSLRVSRALNTVLYCRRGCTASGRRPHSTQHSHAVIGSSLNQYNKHQAYAYDSRCSPGVRYYVHEGILSAIPTPDCTYLYVEVFFEVGILVCESVLVPCPLV